MRNPSLRARLISSPSNFNHLVHVGLSEKQHQLQDLHLVSHRGSATLYIRGPQPQLALAMARLEPGGARPRCRCSPAARTEPFPPHPRLVYKARNIGDHCFTQLISPNLSPASLPLDQAGDPVAQSECVAPSTQHESAHV